LQSKPSRFLTDKIAKPIHQVSRFVGDMAVRMLELAQRRIATSIAALKRVLAKPPPSPMPRPPTLHIKSMFLRRAQPRRKLRNDFKPF
jgi:hypothetical protein